MAGSQGRLGMLGVVGRLAGVVVGLALAGCGAGPSFLGNTLEGTVGSSADLSFDSVEARRFADGEVEVRYVRSANGNSEVVAKVVVQVPSEGITYGQDIDLKAHNGAVARAVASSPDFPALDNGSIRFDTGAVKADEATRGRFNATFTTGKTLKGTFDAQLKLVAN